MIVRTTGQDLLFITQPDHAHLSRKVMERCSVLQDHPRAASILLAIGEHDNGWREADAAPTIDPASGRPFDFVSAPPAVRQDVWPRGVARLAADPWAGALVATHAMTIYDRYRADAAWSAFFERMEALRAEMVRASGGRVEDLVADYPFVRLGDLISLVFCTGWTEEQGFGGWTVARSAAAVTVAPDPFAGRTIPLAIAARRLPAITFRSDSELWETLSSAALTTLRGEVRGRRRG